MCEFQKNWPHIRSQFNWPKSRNSIEHAEQRKNERCQAKNWMSARKMIFCALPFIDEFNNHSCNRCRWSQTLQYPMKCFMRLPCVLLRPHIFRVKCQYRLSHQQLVLDYDNKQKHFTYFQTKNLWKSLEIWSKKHLLHRITLTPIVHSQTCQVIKRFPAL